MVKRYRFPPEIIQTAGWLHHRFKLSHRDVEDLLARGASPAVIRTMKSSIPCGGPWAKTVTRLMYSCKRGEMETSPSTFLGVYRINTEESIRI
jgi:hypothetical protein